MKLFEPKILSLRHGYSRKQLISDVIAGVIVAIIALPLSIALAIASGVSPEKGLYTAIVAGLVIGLLGGSNVNISGPTAAFATIVAGIVAQFGIEGLVVATILAGILLILMGLFRLGSLIKFIPHTITTGFTSGIAVTIVIGQIKDFLGLTFPKGTNAIESVEKLEAIVHSLSSFNWQALLVGLIGLAVLIVWPKISRRIPGSLVAVVVGVLLVKLLPLNVNTIGDLYAISRDLPTFSMPALSFEILPALIPSAFTIAILAAIESLLSCVVSDGMIDDRHNSNTELIAQGAGNIFSGLFGGIPATGAIARTAANVKNGGRTPISAIVHALVLLLILVVLMPYAAWIPMPIIAAILFMVAYNMCEWRPFLSICKTAPFADVAVLIVTFMLTVVFDLVVAISVGIGLAILFFLKDMTTSTKVISLPCEKTDEKHYTVQGPLFFATSDLLRTVEITPDCKRLSISLEGTPMLDATATKALSVLARSCREREVLLCLTDANERVSAVLKKAGLADFLTDTECEIPSAPTQE